MARGLPGGLSAGRELLDRLARQLPVRLTVGTFIGAIGTFTALLSMPWATASGQRAPFVDALFTATSAVSVTGLVTVPTGAYWSTGGQVTILVAIKLGGLAVMTLASILALAVSRRIGLTQRLIADSERRTTRLGEIGSLVRTVVLMSTGLELAIALLIVPRFRVLGESDGQAVWHGIFYAVSAFNNAGFVPTADGLAPYVSDWWVLMPLIVGVFIGSLGFPVILEVSRNLRHPRRWNLHTKLTLVTSIALAAAGSLLVAAFEWNNPHTLGRLSGSAPILESLFAGVMPRSAGFSTMAVGQMHQGTWLVNDALMFVGGGSASTAGGIKVTTLAVMILAIVAEARGDRDVEAFGRRVPREALQVAIAVTLVSATVVLVACLLLLAITSWTLDRVLFEVVSAFSTTGLSTGLTGQLPVAGKYIVTVLMFIGRVGTMTFAAALALRNRRRVIRLPEERPLIG